NPAILSPVLPSPVRCLSSRSCVSLSLLFNASPTTAIYTLSLHDALPIYARRRRQGRRRRAQGDRDRRRRLRSPQRRIQRHGDERSEEHTSELQSRRDLVCRLLLEKKKKEQRTKN